MVLCISNSLSKGLDISIWQYDTVTLTVLSNAQNLAGRLFQMHFRRANHMMVRVRGLESWGIPSLLTLQPFCISGLVNTNACHIGLNSAFDCCIYLASIQTLLKNKGFERNNHHMKIVNDMKDQTRRACLPFLLASPGCGLPLPPPASSFARSVCSSGSPILPAFYYAQPQPNTGIRPPPRSPPSLPPPPRSPPGAANPSPPREHQSPTAPTSSKRRPGPRAGSAPGGRPTSALGASPGSSCLGFHARGRMSRASDLGRLHFSSLPS
jgi:hypothetical protein